MDKLKIQEVADLHTSVDQLEREVAILTARHTAIFSYPAEDEEEKFLQGVTLAEIGREIRERLNKLFEITGDQIYKP
jgi:hypothetical protein